MARHASTYRGARRNAARADKQIRYWRLLEVVVTRYPKRGTSNVFIPYPTPETA
jgi:hypothetical protein